jgi:hypothetical protein
MPGKWGRGQRWADRDPEVRKRANERRRWQRLEELYGVTKDQYLALHKKQKGKCALCGWKPKSNQRRLSVDHCHKSKAVRGLLCMHCNYDVVGYIEKHPVLWENLKSYLER